MRIDWTKVGALWNSGHSIVVNGAHRYAPAIECAVSQIASTFGRPVSANAYMTPKSGVGSSALLEHADSTIVAAVQIAGSKVWQVSTGSIKLQPRDVLLLAPEVTHAPHAVSGEGSVHISFVLEVSGEIETTQRASMIGNAPTLGEILGLNVDC